MEKDVLVSLGVSEEAIEAIMESESSLRGEYEARIREIEKENEIEKIVSGSGAKNVKAVRALLEGCEGDDYREKVSAQLEEMKKGRDTSFLFASKSFEPARSGEKIPKSEPGEYQVRLNDARNRGDRISAIKIKQEAAKNGIMLI